MTASQKIQIRQSETREKLNELTGATSAEDIARRNVLDAEYKGQEVEFRRLSKPRARPTLRLNPESGPD